MVVFIYMDNKILTPEILFASTSVLSLSGYVAYSLIFKFTNGENGRTG